MPQRTAEPTTVIVEGQNAAMRGLIEAMMKSPVATATLGCVVVGGAFMYFNVTAEGANMRNALAAAVDKGASTNSRQDTQLLEQKAKIERLEGIVIDMRGDLREIVTTLRYLTKDRTPEEKPR